MKHSQIYLNIKQEENDLIPRLLEQYVDHPIDDLPKIVKRMKRKFPGIKKFIFEIQVN